MHGYVNGSQRVFSNLRIYPICYLRDLCKGEGAKGKVVMFWTLPGFKGVW